MSPVFDNKCVSCRFYRGCKESFNSWIYFIVGLIATIAIRVVLIFHALHPIYGKIAWYVGVTGFFMFFLYKFRVNSRRQREIKRLGLHEKIGRREPLGEKDYENIGLILCSLASNKEKINYMFIFATSVIALVIAVYFDFVG